MYVDDEPDMLELGRFFIETNKSCQVISALSASAAIIQLKDTPVDAIVSDYSMPGMDGIAFLEHARSIRPGIPFILFTGRECDSRVMGVLNNINTFYLQKGFDLEDQFKKMILLVKNALNLRHIQDDLPNLDPETKQLLENPDMAVVVICDYVIQRCNRKAMELFGCTDMSQIIGHALVDFSVLAQWDRLGSQFQMESIFRKAAQCSEKKIHWKHQRADGTPICSEVSLRYRTCCGHRFFLGILNPAKQ
jgi:DNA-binding NarL/FixJ family response regulator